MKRSKNILNEKEPELVSLLMQDCQGRGDIQTPLLITIALKSMVLYITSSLTQLLAKLHKRKKALK